MLSLHENTPNDIEFEGKTYGLDCSFNVVLSAFEAIKDKDMTVTDRMETFLCLLVMDDLPPIEKWADLYGEIQSMLFSDNSKPVRYDLDGNPMKAKSSGEKPNFDFDYDADYIYSAFYQAYGIDLLNEFDLLDWFKFMALINGLPDNTAFSQIRQIRSTKLSKIKDRDRRKQIAKQQAKFALPLDDDGGED